MIYSISVSGFDKADSELAAKIKFRLCNDIISVKGAKK